MTIESGTWTDEEIQEDKASQFEDMNYTMECNTCGETIATMILIRDLERPYWTVYESIYLHNMTHYEAPQIGA